jgi:hypothetical protein
LLSFAFLSLSEVCGIYKNSLPSLLFTISVCWT